MQGLRLNFLHGKRRTQYVEVKYTSSSQHLVFLNNHTRSLLLIFVSFVVISNICNTSFQWKVLWASSINFEEEVVEHIHNQKQIVKRLLDILVQKPKDLPTHLQWCKSAKLAGWIRSEEASSLLIEQITNASLTTERTLETLYPAVGALIQIGYPSVQAILNRGFLRERNELEQKLMAHVIRRVLGQGYRNSLGVGTRLGRLIIQEHLRSAEPPAPVRDRLVKFMEKHFPVEKTVKRR